MSIRTFLKTKGLPGIISLCILLGSTQAAQQWLAAYPDGADGEVVALWHFDADKPGEDASGLGHHLKLRGEESRFVEKGRFGGGLEIGGLASDDTRQGASTPSSDDLSPQGPFTVELWIAPSSALQDAPIAFLIDKKYYHAPDGTRKTNNDYLLLLRRVGKEWAIEAHLGFGESSERLSSSPQNLRAGEWSHIALTYDGAGGAKIYLDGLAVGEAHWDGRTSIAKGPLPLTIGDRHGSKAARFLGCIDEVRISHRVVPFAPREAVLLQSESSRFAFERMETKAYLEFSVANHRQHRMEGASVVLTESGGVTLRAPLEPLAPGEQRRVRLPLDTSLRADRYAWMGVVTDEGGTALSDPVKVDVTITPRPLPHVMPVVLWGGTDNTEALKRIGFTHRFVSIAQAPYEAESTAVATARKKMDDLFAVGIGSMVNANAGRNPINRTKYNRVDRAGKPYARENIDGLLPGAKDYFRQVGRSMSAAFGDLPGFQGVLLNTEVRDSTKPSFHSVDQEAYKARTGKIVPAEVVDARGVQYAKLANFPGSRIIPDNAPLLTYYQWFWKEGDGWNDLNTEVASGLKEKAGPRVWTWYDPAVRAPSLYGSGGAVDYLNQWTYTYPDPLKIGLACNETLAMAQGRPGQKVMAMTQAIWYRSQTAPMPKPGSSPSVPPVGWELEKPDAKFITIAPDHLSEALWLNLSYPIEGVMYHGVGSLIGEKQGSYILTNTETQTRLTQLVKEVVVPLGPTLKQIPDIQPDVAFLESATSQLFADRGTYGWGGGWGADSWLISQYAGLQSRVIYEETIAQKGLGDYRVLFLTHCDVLPQSIADAVREFQRKGGILIADEFLVPGIDPDILIPSEKRTGKGDADKALLMQKAGELRAALSPFYTPAMASSNPEVILRQRAYGTAQYLFVVNDHRTYGDYVGHHGKVMEKGLPSEAVVTLKRDLGRIYDLKAQKEVPVRVVDGELQFDVQLPPGEGGGLSGFG